MHAMASGVFARPPASRSSRPDAGCGHRGHHGDFQRRQPDPLRTAVVPGALKDLKPPTYGTNVAFNVSPLVEEITSAVRPILLTLLAAVMAVLLIACVNVTNLLLARSIHRRAEFALRAALGAGLGRLLRQVLVESVLLAAMGGIVELAVAASGLDGLVALSPPGLPRAGAIRVDAAVLLFSLAITALVGATVGMAPALQVARCNPQQDLRHGSRTIGRGHSRLRGALVVGEVALALVLLVGSGLLFRSLKQVFALPTGFDPSHMLTMQLQPGGRRGVDRNATHQYYEQVLAAVRRTPGVVGASITSQLPLSGDRDESGVHFESHPNATSSCFRYAVSPEYLRTMRIPLRAGRLFEHRDGAGRPLVALISESLARRRFPTESPIGRRLRIGPADGPLYTVVGIVGDLKQVSLVASDSDAVYTTAAQWLFPERTMSLVVRGES
jgi:predicted permease